MIGCIYTEPRVVKNDKDKEYLVSFDAALWNSDAISKCVEFFKRRSSFDKFGSKYHQYKNRRGE